MAARMRIFPARGAHRPEAEHDAGEGRPPTAAAGGEDWAGEGILHAHIGHSRTPPAG